ncbi:YciI family protein [Massilia sp. LXY-6]|uniref:YciI family protein n=1 Tax=Massilia sp. LXY-6 TaxID=3379823 RepID=UPI003EDEDFF6
MTQYLVAIHHPDDFDPASEGEAVRAEISALNREMIEAGVRVFVGGLRPVAEARSVRRPAGGAVQFTDGPYLEAKEHVGGFWVLECASLDEALEWGRKAALACRAGVEVRAFYAMPGRTSS